MRTPTPHLSLPAPAPRSEKKGVGVCAVSRVRRPLHLEAVSQDGRVLQASRQEVSELIRGDCCRVLDAVRRVVKLGRKWAGGRVEGEKSSGQRWNFEGRLFCSHEGI